MPFPSKVLDRFWKYVNKDLFVHPTCGPCWIWTASTVSGYGQLRIDGKIELAHRLSWKIHLGPIPNGLWVLHKCDNHLCVNPDHLFLGTIRDNTADACRKGRNARGESHGHARLTEQDVLDIRSRYVEFRGNRNNSRMLALEYKVGDRHIRQIVSRHWWNHI